MGERKNNVSGKNRLFLLLTKEDEYVTNFDKIIKLIGDGNKKICYVTITRPYEDTINELKNMDIDTSNLFFVDTLTSYYMEHPPVDNCIFVDGPTDLTKMKNAIKTAINEEKCNAIIFDTISKLMIYKGISSIVRFTHELLSENGERKTKKMFLLQKNSDIEKEEHQRLISDLSMFADEIIDI
ncbi:MAG: hypothetical protein KAS04_01365 [Candidatus Aenigmarchaeota archaeon]|nr:hypothetical protein [Candidatus Aenigmarchaeota archaeon]